MADAAEEARGARPAAPGGHLEARPGGAPRERLAAVNLVDAYIQQEPIG